MEWYEKWPSRWATEQEIASKFLENCEVGRDAQGRAFIAGVFHLISEHGHEYDAFRVRLVYPSAFPARCCGPSAYLDSHRDRWRNLGESHIENDWRLCLYVPLESGIDFRQTDSLKVFFACLRSFLFKERIYQRDVMRENLTNVPAEWPGPARSHGTQGIREAIRDRGGIGRNDPCPCGSGKKFKQCCISTIGGK